MTLYAYVHLKAIAHALHTVDTKDTFLGTSQSMNAQDRNVACECSRLDPYFLHKKQYENYQANPLSIAKE